MTETEAVNILISPATSYWLKRAWGELVARDPVDATYDAELLAEMMRARLKGIQGGD